MSPEPIAAVMIHVIDVQEALAWYERAFPEAVRVRSELREFDFLRVGKIQLEIVPSDAKVSAGPKGSVVYWRTADLNAKLAHLQSLGATLYRGPMQIEENLSMCQVQDLWGNCIGLRGPALPANARLQTVA